MPESRQPSEIAEPLSKNDPQRVMENETERLQRLIKYNSLLSTFKELWWTFIIGAFFSWIEYNLMGWEWTAGSIAVYSFIVGVYTKKIYKPPGEYVTEFGFNNGTLTFHMYRIPRSQYDMIPKELIQFPGRTNYGQTYFASYVDYDFEHGIVRKIRYMWPHRNQYHFVQRYQLFEEMNEMLETYIQLYNRQKELGNVLSQIEANRLTDARMSAMESAYRDEYAKVSSKLTRLSKEVESLVKQNEALHIQTNDKAKDQTVLISNGTQRSDA